MLRRIVRGMIALVFGQGVGIATKVFLVPLYLRSWTPEVYGEWLAMSSVVAYLTNLDMGMQMYVVNRLTQDHAQGNASDYRASQHTALAFYTAIAGIGTLVVAALTYLLPLTRWLRLAQTPPSTAVVVMTLLGAQLLWSLPLTFNMLIYRTTGDFAKSQWLGNFFSLLMLLLVGTALWFRSSMPALAALELVPMAVVAVYVQRDVRRRLPALTPGFSAAKVSLLGSLIRPSLFFSLIVLAIALGQQGPILVVSGVLGGAAVALFATTRTLAAFARQVVGTLNQVIWADVTRLQASDDRARLRPVLHLLVGITTAGCVAVSASLWFEGPDVLARWTHGRLAPDPSLIRLLLVYAVLQAPWGAASLLPAATNRHRSLAFSYLAANSISVLGTLALIHRLGLIAVPLALIAGEALACYHFVIRDACAMVGEPYWPFAARVWGGLAAIGSAALGMAWAAHQATSLPSVARWALSGAGSASVCIVLTWLFWLTASDRRMLKNKFRGRGPWISDLWPRPEPTHVE
jgi:O-antigen/teichoic acid export membrane protein